MKLTKRIKSSLLQAFIFNVILFIAVVVFVIFVLWPSFGEIQAKKSTLSTQYTRLTEMKKQGIEFQEFKALANNSEISGYLKEIITVVSKSFYDRNFKNSSREIDFESFITDKETSVLEEKKASILENKTDVVDTLLPVYVTNNSEDGITDFEFINYVESLLYSFNLISTDSIGVGELKRVETLSSTKTNLDSNIFYIPLKLDITGQKSDIIDFIHFFENVGSISIDEGDTKIYTDEVLSKNITGTPNQNTGNIYKNQFSDIRSISMDRYIDTSSDVSRGSLTDFIKSTQSRQRFSAELDLRFYVQGLPDYKIENYVQSVIKAHASLLSESQEVLKLTFNSSASESSSTLKAKNAIRSAANILTLMQDDIKNLRVDLGKKDKDLMVIYNDAESYMDKIKKIEMVMQESATVLNTKN